MRFVDFLVEQNKKTVVAAFGRFSPPTIGHGLLVKKVQEVAKSLKADHVVYASKTQDNKKNPLDVNTKVKYLRKMFPGAHFEAANEDVRTFMEMAGKLYDAGYNNFVLVAGSDRVPEYQKLLDKYNGQEFKFDSVKVVSAGERDPDAEGAAGMSATKMREAAIKNDFKSFRSGIPSSLSDKDTQDLMNHVRSGLKIKESLDDDFEELLTEGVHDKSIFKAVFLGGGPGSGKDFVLDKTLTGHGLTEINSDKAFEFLMDKNNLDMKMPESEEEQRNFVRGKAKSMTELKQKLALLGRNGVIINGTGDDPEKIKKIKDRLEELGYETSMVMVNTADDVSQQRNIERGQRGGRTVPEKIRKEKWDGVQAARPQYAEMFGDAYKEFDNSEDLRTAAPEVVKSKNDELMSLFKGVRDFVSKPPQNELAQQWVASELQKKDTAPIPKAGSELTPHQDSAAGDEARRLGLQYYGFGRYGKNGKVTHRSIHDKLTPVDKIQKEIQVPTVGTSSGSIRQPSEKQKERLQATREKSPLKKVKEDIDDEFENFITEDLRKWFDPNHPEGGWKRVNAKGEAIGPCAREPGEAKPKCMSNEKRAALSKKERASAVAAKRRHDPDPERKGKPINVSNFGKGKISEAVSVSFTADTPEELNSAMTGFFNKQPDMPTEEYSFSGKDALTMLTGGKKVASSYVRNDEMTITNADINQMMEEKNENYLKDANGNPRIFMLRRAAAREAHQKQGEVAKHSRGWVVKLPKKMMNESIDKGIETGTSMAGAGESIGRDMGEKIKKRTGKATQVAETIGAGGEMATSMSDQKEDELKKKGISLTSFRAKRPIG
jgi:nicotinamide mononucleotide adenylyltransferase